MGNDKPYSISLKSGCRKMAEIGEEAEPVVTNSESLAKTIEKANCEICKEVGDAVSEEVRRQDWAIAHMQLE